jgi:hypothetical protein
VVVARHAIRVVYRRNKHSSEGGGKKAGKKKRGEKKNEGEKKVRKKDAGT